MLNKRIGVLAVAAAAVLLVGACSSSKAKPVGSGSPNTTGSTGATGSSSGKTITVGVLSDLTGAAASGNQTFEKGVAAGAILAKRDGYTLKYFVGDTQTSPAATLTAAQKLVEQDHVLVVLAGSALTFAAAQWLNAHNVPVVGEAEDAGEWATDMNMFGIGGPLHITGVTTTFGQLLKIVGATNIGTLGYSISPSSADSSLEAAKSAQSVGLKAGYTNPGFPFGSTNVGPVAIQMKGAGIDAFYASVDPNTSFALISALRQEGVNLKAAVLPDGYGADTLQAGPGALQTAQNVYFTLGYEPIEMHTAATQQFASDLAASGTAGAATFGEYNGYLSVGLLLQALKTAGSAPTQAALITALSGIHNWDSLGLWGGRTLDINNRVAVEGPQLCSWVAKLVGTSFQLVPGAEPICGTVIPNETVGKS
jgi:ABC-type branched-subunit amino acid transport system substrate-binding protein